MRLDHIDISIFPGTDHSWRADVELAPVTLLAGRNATGKSKVLSGIHNLSELVSGKRSFGEAHYRARFDDSGIPFLYDLEISESVVRSERVVVAGEELLSRNADGSGSVRSIERGEALAFQIPTRTLAVAAKRDLIQHPFLEPIHAWAEAVRFYRFNEFSRLDFYTLLGADGASGVPDPSNFRQSVALFFHAATTLGPSFSKIVLEDLARIGYPCSEVGLERIKEVSMEPAGIPPLGLTVHEHGRKARTNQILMSDGMYRALALIVHSAYAELASEPSCMLIDDIGEGLDYERSTELIKLLMERAERKAIQLVMSTNDRFVMNAVPLEYWCGLRRTPSGPETITIRSHPEVFEEFRMTGLNNFDFLRTDFFEAPSLRA